MVYWGASWPVLQICLPSPCPAAGPPPSVPVNKLLIPGSTLHWSCRFPMSDGTTLALKACHSRSAPNSPHSASTGLRWPCYTPASSPFYVFLVHRDQYQQTCHPPGSVVQPLPSSTTELSSVAPLLPELRDLEREGDVWSLSLKFCKTCCQTKIEYVKCEGR